MCQWGLKRSLCLPKQSLVKSIVKVFAQVTIVNFCDICIYTNLPISHHMICLLCGTQVYDSGNGLLAPRVWWCLSYHGHPAPLILDGGYARWVKEGRDTELAEPCPLTASPDFQQWHRGCKIDQKNDSQGSSRQDRPSKVSWVLLSCYHRVHQCSNHDMAVLGDMCLSWGYRMGTGDIAFKLSIHNLKLMCHLLVHSLTVTSQTLQKCCYDCCIGMSATADAC